MKLAWNVKKNTVGSLKNLEREQNRENANNRNKLIDKSKSHLNYELVPGSRDLTEKTLDLVEKSRVNGSRIQKNSVVDLSNIITLSREEAETLGDDGTKRFFSLVVEYFQEEFGKENVTSAIVHLDETTPHMHLHVTPVNKDNGKLQAHKVMTRGRVNKIHTELPEFLQKHGFNVERGSSREKDGTRKDYVRDINKLKQMTEKEHEKYQRLREKKSDARFDVYFKQSEVNELNNEISNLKGQKEEIEREMAERLAEEEKAREKALNAKLEYEREMEKLFNQKMALSDELDELRELVADTQELAESVNTYKDGGYKIPLTKFEWEDRYRPLNVFEREFSKLNDISVIDRLKQDGRADDLLGLGEVVVDVKLSPEVKFELRTYHNSSDISENSRNAYRPLKQLITDELRREQSEDISRGIMRYKKFLDSDLFDDVESTLEKNEQLQEKYSKRVSRKRADDFER